MNLKKWIFIILKVNFIQFVGKRKFQIVYSMKNFINVRSVRWVTL